MLMVAKQYWRLIHNSDSLVARILKERYHPRGNIDSATVGYQPSYLWHRILNARELVEEWTTWQVGNDSLIDCFANWWIRTNEQSKLSRGNTEGLHSPRVAELNLDDRINKNCNKILNLFNAEETLNILQIPLSLRRSMDKRIWNHSKNGNFIV